MRVTITAPLPRPLDEVDIASLTASVPDGRPYWEPDEVLVIPFTPEPTAAEQTAIIRRITSTDADEETQRTTIADALADLDAFADGSGTLANAALTVAVRRLARALAATIRLMLRRRA